ncbi:type VI secretion system-associated FHA domain protein TagH [Paracoccus jiaweipingae]|uniref:type VI secretion system-associated FHA domain protein TagH n=1 Tax=unclassified Paracoccus (in: a-proteobacteria) TaxID=2688777 RepID=UPI0037AFCF5C
MTTLVLLIENHDAAGTGAPARIEVPRSGLRAGRAADMDWVLHDASRHISGHHFYISYRDGGWWLTDCSTNGVFLQGQTQRLSGPHRLDHGQRFLVGHYVVVALIGAMGDRDPIRPGSLPSFAARPHAAAADAVPTRPPHGAAGQTATPDTAAPDGAGDGVTDGADVTMLRAFCAGAGLPRGCADGLDAAAIGQALGQALRSSTDHVMLALQDRSAAKLFTDAGARTMLGDANNNPLKFMPDSAQAIEVMFLRPREGFMAGPEALDQALADLRLHNLAVFSAMQPALLELLDQLSPDAIREQVRAEGSGLAAKARWWDHYAAVWEQAAGPGEGGILERFTRVFTGLYAGLVRRGTPPRR